MVQNYEKSEEGVKAYADIGLSYPDELMDRLYEEWLAKTTNRRLTDKERDDDEAWQAAVNESPYESKENRVVHDIVRVRIGEKEFLYYSDYIIRYDDLGNRKRWWRSHRGRYPIPEIVYKREYYVTEEGVTKTKKVQDSVMTRPAYSIPFTKENLEKLHKFALESDPIPAEVTKYYVKDGDSIGGGGGPLITVRSYKDLRDGELEHLIRFGHIPSADEKQLFDDEKAGKIRPLGTVPGSRPYS